MDTNPLERVNNEFYDALGERWHDAQDDPVALLRAESRLRNPWISERLRELVGETPRVLDVGCGGGFLSNYLAELGFAVTGLDASTQSLEVARRHDVSGSVKYLEGDALALPFEDAAFDAVCAMDLLEHVEQPDRVIKEASRVLRPGGLFFFHTFNRNWLAWLIVIKGVEWFVKNTPPNMHVLRLFIKPEELEAHCRNYGLTLSELRGSMPVFASLAFFRLLFLRDVSAQFAFRFTRSTRLAYTGYAVRTPRGGPQVSR